jgi:hypothetical protein
MSKYFGRATVTADGLTLETMKGAKINLGGIKRNEVEGSNTVGFVEEMKSSSIECEIMVRADTPIETIRNIVDATIVFQTDVGHAYMIRNAFCAEVLELTEGEGGKMKAVLKGPPAEKV